MPTKMLPSPFQKDVDTNSSCYNNYVNAVIIDMVHMYHALIVFIKSYLKMVITSYVAFSVPILLMFTNATIKTFMKDNITSTSGL